MKISKLYILIPILSLTLFHEINAQETVPNDNKSKINENLTTSPLTDGLKIGGLIRFRPEMKYNYDFNSKNNDNTDFTGQKVQFFIEKKFNDDVHAKITFQDSRLWGSEKGSPSGLNTGNDDTRQSTDVREAWLEVKNLFEIPLHLQVGRQILIYGDQRLVGSLDWTNVGRSFDGARLKWEEKYFSSHLWAMSIAENNQDIAGNTSALGQKNQYNAVYNCSPEGKSGCSLGMSAPWNELGDSYFTGFYNTIKPSKYLHIDLYYLGLEKNYLKTNNAVALSSKDPGNPETRSGRRDMLHTTGFRITNRTEKGNKSLQAIDYSFEYATQSGTTGKNIRPEWDYGNTSISEIDPLTGSTYSRSLYKEKVKYDSYAYALDLGYTYEKFRLGMGYDVGSGDPNRNDGSIASFQNLFHTNHIWYGLADQVSWVNMIAKSINLTYFTRKFGIFRIDYFVVDKHKKQDGWYAVSGSLKSGASTESLSNNQYNLSNVYTQTGAGNNRPSGFLGKNLFREIDIKYSVPYKSIKWELGYSIIYGGDSIENQINDNTVGLPNNLERNFSQTAEFGYLMMSYIF